MTTSVVTLPGDGIGPEVTIQAVHVLQAVADKLGLQNLSIKECHVGGAAIAPASPHPFTPKGLVVA